MPRNPSHEVPTDAYQDAIHRAWQELSPRERAQRIERAEREAREARVRAAANNRYDNNDTAPCATPNPNDAELRGDGSSSQDYQPTGDYGAEVGHAGFGYGGYYPRR